MTCQDLRVKIFADGANIKEMKQIYNKGIVSGFTTNPSLMRKAGVTDYVSFAKTICSEIQDLPLSFEVFSDTMDEIEAEAREIHTWGKNVYVKIPVTNTSGASMAPLIERLSADGIQLNVTAILTVAQVKEIVKVLTPGVGAYISIFAGRIADTGIDPVPIMRESNDICHAKNGVKSLWASCREVLNVIQADRCGTDIITVTSSVLNKLPMLGMDHTQLSLETVKMFRRDALDAGYKIV